MVFVIEMNDEVVASELQQAQRTSLAIMASVAVDFPKLQIPTDSITEFNEVLDGSAEPTPCS